MKINLNSLIPNLKIIQLFIFMSTFLGANIAQGDIQSEILQLKSGNKKAQDIEMHDLKKRKELLFDHKLYVIIQLDPSSKMKKKQFTAYDIDILEHISHHAFYAAIPEDLSDSALEKLNITGIYSPEVDDKLNSILRQTNASLRLLAKDGFLNVIIQTHKNVNKLILNTLPYLDIYDDLDIHGKYISTAKIHHSDLDKLVSNAYVSYVDLKHDTQTLGNTRAPAVRAGYVQHPDFGNLKGSGINIALHDRIPDHIDIKPNLIPVGSLLVSDHGTMCAGMIASKAILADSKYSGIAPECNLYVGYTHDPNYYADKQAVSIVTGGGGFGEYTSYSSSIDQTLLDFPETMFAVSAGNSGMTGTSIKWHGDEGITSLRAKNYIIDMADFFPDGSLDKEDLTCFSPPGIGLSALINHLNSVYSIKTFFVEERCPTPQSNEIELIFRGFRDNNIIAKAMEVTTTNGPHSIDDVPFRCGFNTVISHTQSAKNVITVGGIYYHPDTVWKQASRGPVEDGRLKPELVAISHGFIGHQTNNNYFNGAGGTSFSGPQVAGGLGLLAEKYKQKTGNLPKGALSKAIICNSATDMGNPGPDYKYGFGKMNLKNAIKALDNGWHDSGAIGHGDFRSHNINVSSNLHQLKVLINWNDLPGFAGDPTSLINDLDLIIKDPVGVLHYPLILDPHDPGKIAISTPQISDHRNNIEQIVIDNPMGGTYEIIVIGNKVDLILGGLQEYHLAYQQVGQELTIITPIKDEIIKGANGAKNGPSHYIEWDYEGPSSTFDIDYSFDNGISWHTIATNLDSKKRILPWNPNSLKDINKNTVKVRVSAVTSGITDVTESFKIYNGIDNLTLEEECQDVVKVSWTGTQDAIAYNVTQYNGVDDMETVLTTPHTSAFVSVDFTQEDIWFAVQAVFANNEVGHRSSAEEFIPSGNTSSCTCAFSDYTALKELFIATDGENWNLSTGPQNTWPSINDFNAFSILQPHMDVNMWEGVSTNSQGCVEELVLINQNLNGSLPTELSLLSNLKRLDLGDNKIVGSIPPSLDQLYNLEFLSLAENDLNGVIPNMFSQYSSLNYLNLTRNNLSGPIPSSIKDLHNLEYLFLRYNSLSGSIPSTIGDLSKLIILSIHNNEFTGSIPIELGNLSSLQNLMLKVNKLSGPIPPQLGSLTNLERLWLFENELTGSIPIELANLPNLSSLIVHTNHLSGCYDQALLSLCNKPYSTNSYISLNNNFDADWQSFCSQQAGMCTPINSTDCPPSVDLSGQIETGDYQAEVSLNSNGLVSDNQTVTFRAGESITLSPEFEINIGGVFTATIGGCL